MKSENKLFRKDTIRSSVVTGFSDTFRSIPLAWKNKGILIYFIIPFILNIAVLSVIFYYSYTSLVPVTRSFLSGDQWYMQLMHALISPVIFVLMSIFTVILYSIAGGIISAPFLDILSLKTEKVSGEGFRDETFSIREILSDVIRALANSIRLLILIIFVNLIMLVLNLVPGGSILYAALNFLSALFFYGFQFYDFPLERRRYSFKEKLSITWKFKWSVFGSGLAFFVISFIPVIGFLGLNLCTMGAAITFTDDIEPVLIKV